MSVHPSVTASHVLHRALTARPEKIVSGSGVTLVLESGQEVLDACAGPSVSCLGHHRPEIAEAVAAQINSIAYVYSGARFTSDPSEKLAELLLSHRPGGLSKAIFVNSGSEATDAALKLATQYWHEVGQPQRTHYVARRQSYHGNTIGALCVSGHQSRRQLYSPWLSQNVSFVDPCYSYRAKLNGESDAEYVQRLEEQLETEILRIGAGKVAGFVAETISGTTLGCLTAVPGYFQAVRRICDKYDILLILDEIMCGMGKTGTMHAWEQEDIRGPDIQMIGKALGAGFVPLSGVLLHEKIFQAIAHGSKGLMHGHTFQAHPTACAAAVEAQLIIKRENLLENVVRRGHLLERLLRDHLSGLPHVADIRGRGLFWSVEFMLDPVKRFPFPATSNFSNMIVNQALDNGLNILGNLGSTGEIHVEHVIIAPAYTVEEHELEAMVDLLRLSIHQVARQFIQRDVEPKDAEYGSARL